MDRRFYHGGTEGTEKHGEERMGKWNDEKPKAKPQRGDIMVEIADSPEFGGAAHRN